MTITIKNHADPVYISQTTYWSYLFLHSKCTCFNLLLIITLTIFYVSHYYWVVALLTCCHVHERHRRQSYNVWVWGRSSCPVLTALTDHEGNTDGGGSLDNHSEHSTRPAQKPAPDWTSPEINEQIGHNHSKHSTRPAQKLAPDWTSPEINEQIGHNHSEHSTRPAQKPALDWTSPEIIHKITNWGIHLFVPTQQQSS